METNQKIVWSDERQKWLCYDDKLIDLVVHSNDFIVPTYDYSAVEEKFNKDLSFTKQAINHFPLSNEGEQHLYLRNRMSQDINANLKNAIHIFKTSFEKKLAAIENITGTINIAKPITEAILESNWAFADIDLGYNFDYSDLTLMLDDSQSIKNRMKREEFIKSFSEKIDEKDCFYKLALISVGVNALIGSTLHSFIKVLSNEDFSQLIKRKYFYSNAIKHLERVCIRKAFIGDEEIKEGDRLRLYVESYEHANLSDVQMNKKFFAADTQHSCIGMSYSLSIWNECVKIMAKHFKDIQLINFDYRSNDGIFNFPTNVNVEYKK